MLEVEKKRLLILCTGNSCRSQMAEGISRHFYSDFFDVFSAGIHPSFVHPVAIAVMGEIGIDISNHRSKSVSELTGHGFDCVMTVCGKADQNCPVFLGKSKRIHWGFDDPAQFTGNSDEILNEFRRIRDAIVLKFRMDWEGILS